jgi:hypothetical protein
MVPNTPAAAFAPQAGLDSGDLQIMAAAPALTGVVSGCAVTAQGSPDMTVAVAAGVVRIGGRKVVVAGGNVTITAAHGTNPRHDLITVDTSGVKAAVAGTPAAVTATTEPVFPAIPANRVVLAAVYVPAADTAINANQITDKRVIIDNPRHENVRWYGATGDGVTNDRAALQLAIDTAGIGGIVYFPRGSYLVQDDGIGRPAILVTPTPIRLIGEGGVTPFAPSTAGNSTIELPAGESKYILTHSQQIAGDWAHGGIIEGLQFRAAPSLRWPDVGTTTTATTGGTLAAGRYSYRVTAITAIGESRPSLEHTIVTTGATSTVTLNWTAAPANDERPPPAVTGYKVYGRVRGNWQLMATLGDVLTWTDTGSVTPSGAMNQVNTSGQVRGGGIKWRGGENSIFRDLAFTDFPEAGVSFRLDRTTQLNGAINNSVTAIAVDSGAQIANGSVIQIDGERMTVTAGGGTTSLTVTRASWGTAAASHADNAMVYKQEMGDSAPMYVENLCTYRNRMGVHWDHAAGPFLVNGWTGDDDNYQMAITNNSSDPNDSGNFLQVTIVGVKAEVSINGGHVGHSPWLYINNGNECAVKIIGGRISDYGVPEAQRRLFHKNLVTITNGWHGFASPYSCSVTFESTVLEGYRNLFVDTVRGEIVPWNEYAFPEFKKIDRISHGGVTYQRSEAANTVKTMQIRGPTTPMVKMTQVATTPLTANVTTAAVQLSVVGITGFPATFPYLVRVGGEIMRVDSRASNVLWNVTRNQAGSEAGIEEHVQGSYVTYEGDAYLMSGQTAPEGITAAPSGSLYLQQLGAANQPSAYVKDLGAGNTGWVALDGWDFLAATQLGSAAATTGAITIPARHMLLVAVRVTSLSASDTAALRFNGDSGANYWDRQLSSVPGGASWVNTQTLSTTQMRIMAPAGITGFARLIFLTNLATNPKVASWGGAIGTGAAGTAGNIGIGGGEWVNTAAQITTIELKSTGGSALLGANSGFAVFGRKIA